MWWSCSRLQITYSTSLPKWTCFSPQWPDEPVAQLFFLPPTVPRVLPLLTPSHTPVHYNRPRGRHGTDRVSGPVGTSMERTQS